jgi:5-methylcytosine-specific restriction endonuclease McrA
MKRGHRSYRLQLIRAAREDGRVTVTLECPKHGLTQFRILEPTGTRCKKCNSDAVKRRRKRVKRILVAEAGGECRLCGYDRAPEALEFHHLDPKTKSFGLSQAGCTRSIAASRREIAKCVLLCANCHAEVEAGVRDLPVM